MSSDRNGRPTMGRDILRGGRGPRRHVAPEATLIEDDFFCVPDSLARSAAAAEAIRLIEARTDVRVKVLPAGIRRPAQVVVLPPDVLGDPAIYESFELLRNSDS